MRGRLRTFTSTLTIQIKLNYETFMSQFFISQFNKCHLKNFNLPFEYFWTFSNLPFEYFWIDCFNFQFVKIYHFPKYENGEWPFKSWMRHGWMDGCMYVCMHVCMYVCSHHSRGIRMHFEILSGPVHEGSHSAPVLGVSALYVLSSIVNQAWRRLGGW